MSQLPDTQNETDERDILIDRVGVKELRYPVTYEDGAGKLRSTNGKFEMTVELPAAMRGTHMSRFVELLNEADTVMNGENLGKLTHQLAERLHAERAHVSCEFTVFMEKTAPVSGLKSLMDYELGLEYRHSRIEGEDDELFLSIQVPVATLCPCSKAISDRGAHNQRGLVTISVLAGKNPDPLEFIQLAEKSASCGLYAGLKRTDEKAVTELAYDQPRFVEDLARNVAVGLRVSEKVEWYRVEVENFESIHNHNAYAMIES